MIKKTVKKIYKRKTAKGRNYKKATTSTPWPYQKIVKLRYVEQFSLSPTVASTVNYLFRCNDLYDPNYTGVGHQPRGFDQYMTMYRRFCVIGSKIKNRFTINELDNTVRGDLIVGIRPDTLVTTSTDLIDLTENRSSRYVVLPSNDEKGKSITSTFSYKNWVKGKPLNNPEACGSISASPANEIYFHVFAGPIATSFGAVPTVSCLAEIEYVAIMFDPISPVIS